VFIPELGIEVEEDFVAGTNIVIAALFVGEQVMLFKHFLLMSIDFELEDGKKKEGKSKLPSKLVFLYNQNANLFLSTPEKLEKSKNI